MTKPYIHWYKGMNILPHHMQQMQISIIQNQTYLLSNLCPDSWGVISLKIDEFSSTKSIIRILSLECIMPDFSIISIPSESIKNLEFECKKSNDFTIYLSLPNNFNLYPAQNSPARYRSVLSTPTPDITTGSDPQALTILEPAPYLTSLKSNDACLPIAKCTTKAGQVQLLPYDPPSPNFHLCTITSAKLYAIVEDVAAKINHAYSKFTLKNDATDFNSYGSTLAQALLPLKSSLSNSSIRPSLVFQALATFASIICNIIEPSIPDYNKIEYDHSDILSSFAPLLSFVQSKLDLIERLYTSDIGKFSLEKHIFSKSIPLHLDSIKLIMYFDPKADFNRWISNSIITSSSLMEKIQHQRLLGYKRDILESSNMMNNLRSVVVRITLDKMPDPLLLIRSNIYHDDSPKSIYVFE